jgi:cell division protein FtsA
MTGDKKGGADVLGLIDIGTSKICCTIVVPNRGGDKRSGPHVIGIGHQRSQGVKAGVVVDLHEAENAVRAAVAQAERMARVQLEEVIVGVSCGRMRSNHFAARADLESGVVRKDDLRRLTQAARAYAERDGRLPLYLDRLIYRIDGDAGVQEPIGMAGNRLTADVHAITADEAPLRNLKLLIERCYLSLGSAIPSALASILAVTSEEERRIGITCLDIGGGTTSISVFADNRFLLADVVPIGGQHMTFDIARELGTPIPEAERIKALYGTLVSAGSDEHEMFTYPLAGEGDSAFHQTTRARLRAILQPRMEGLLALVNERMQRSEIMRYAGERVVLTGGASQLVGIDEFAANALGRPVRVARPLSTGGPSGPNGGLPANMSLPAFACVAGLLPAAQMVQGGWASFPEYGVGEHGYFGRMGQWLRQSF